MGWMTTWTAPKVTKASKVQCVHVHMLQSFNKNGVYAKLLMIYIYKYYVYICYINIYICTYLLWFSNSNYPWSFALSGIQLRVTWNLATFVARNLFRCHSGQKDFQRGFRWRWRVVPWSGEENSWGSVFFTGRTFWSESNGDRGSITW